MADIFWQESAAAPGPWAPFDRDAKLDFEFDAGPWVRSAGEGLTLTSATVIDAPALAVDRQAITSEGVIRFRLQLAEPTANVRGPVPFTIRMVLSDQQQDDRTFYLMVRQR